MNSGLQCFIAIAMLLGNAFFVGAEFGLVSSRRSNIELEALNGSRSAKLTLTAMESVSLMLAGAQLGVTLCSLIFGAVAEPLLAHALEQPFATLGLSQALHPVALILALALLSYVHVVLGEMVPKNLALAGPTRAALWLTPALLLFVRATMPLVRLLNGIAAATVRLLGLTPKAEITSSFSRDEVAGFVQESHREGLLSEDEEQLLSGALSFDKSVVNHILLPLDELVTIAPHTSATTVEKLAGETGFSRFPVRRGNKLIGYVHIKDLLDAAASQHEEEPLSPAHIRELPELRPSTSLRRSLAVMQRAGAHLASVTDSHGKTLGVVALEDVLEELIGEIQEEASGTTRADGDPV